MEYATEKAQQREDRRKKKPDNKSKKASGVSIKLQLQDKRSTQSASHCHQNNILNVLLSGGTEGKR